MTQDKTEVVVIGAGVIGLAIAKKLSDAGKEVIVIEKESQIGTQISSRHSEVIHAGIYYPRETLKTQLCILGKEQLYAYLKERQLPHRQIGKLLIAETPEQHNQLVALQAQAEDNGIEDLQLLRQIEVSRLEAECVCYSALYSPSSGIIDSHAYLESLCGDIRDNGGIVATQTMVSSIVRAPSGRLEVSIEGPSAMKLQADHVINAAGLDAQYVAYQVEGIRRESIPILYLAKGNYYRYLGKSPFSHLVYPLPQKGGLGVHLTLNMQGELRFGPDVEWVKGRDYEVNASKQDYFYQAVRRYYPGVKRDRLRPDFAGIRPKLHPPAEAFADFMLQTESEHGVAGLINCFGIESPGLTSSLAIGELLTRKLLG